LKYNFDGLNFKIENIKKFENYFEKKLNHDFKELKFKNKNLKNKMKRNNF
jgi:hypothetical protein